MAIATLSSAWSCVRWHRYAALRRNIVFGLLVAPMYMACRPAAASMLAPTTGRFRPD